MSQIHRSTGAVEHHRARLEILDWCAGIVIGVQWTLSHGEIACRVDELSKVAVCHRLGLNPEFLDGYSADRAFLGVMPTGSQRCRLRGNTYQIRCHEKIVRQSSRMLATAHPASAARSSARSAPSV